jgi:hypothetical protein
MDPTSRGPEEYGHDAEDRAPRPRPSREALTPDFGQHAASPVRMVRLVAVLLGSPAGRVHRLKPPKGVVWR